MTLRALAIAVVAAGTLAAPQAAQAAGWGTVVGASALNLRACPSVQCQKVAVMPGGAPVWINGVSGGWYHVVFNGVPGYASGRYVATANVAPPVPYPTAVVRRPPPPPPHWWWWGPRYPTWYRPSGLYLGFHFGG